MAPDAATPSSEQDRAQQDRAAAVAYCAGRDVACPRCGYNLRDIGDGACPECGRIFEVGVIKDRGVDLRAALRVSVAWSLLVAGTMLGVEAAYWILARGRPAPYSTQDALEIVVLVLMLVYGVGAFFALLFTDGRSLRHAVIWLRVGWVLWGAGAGFIVARALPIAAGLLGVDC